MVDYLIAWEIFFLLLWRIMPFVLLSFPITIIILRLFRRHKLI